MIISHILDVLMAAGGGGGGGLGGGLGLRLQSVYDQVVWLSSQGCILGGIFFKRTYVMNSLLFIYVFRCLVFVSYYLSSIRC